jgi:hypothetical protein
MKKYCLLVIAISLLAVSSFAQVGINNDNSAPDPAAMLDVKSSERGFLPPRMTTQQRDAISAPVAGLQIYNSDCNDMQYYNGAGWIPMGNSGQLAQPGSITGISHLV